MDAVAELHRFYEDLNARRFDTSSDLWAPDMRFHAPGIGAEATSWEAAIAEIRKFVEFADAEYRVDRVVEQGPFLVAFVTTTGVVGGRPVSWSLCNVGRMQDGRMVEAWALRGGEPVPIEAG